MIHDDICVILRALEPASLLMAFMVRMEVSVGVSVGEGEGGGELNLNLR